ncbi:MAG: serine hydrolase domain-containing protein [Mycobacterium sp.]
MTDPYATAQDLGLMQGFPPPPGKRVDRSNALMTGPFNRWAYLHMRTIFPSAPLRTSAAPRPIPFAINTAITRLEVARPDGSVTDFATFLRETYTDSFLVVTPERLVYEHYGNAMNAAQPHQMMSCTKSFAGLFALMAGLDESGRVTDVVPELSVASAFADATIGQVLDMVNSMNFNEDYADPRSDIGRYVAALGWMDDTTGTAADSLYDFLLTLPIDPAHAHGEIFHYQTPKTDVLNWITNRATGKTFQDNMSDVLWTRLGTEAEAYVLLDRCGTLVAGGGLNAAPRDLARFAMMMLNGGSVDGEQIVAPAIIETLERGGDREAFANGPAAVGYMATDWSYRAQWWIRHTPNREAITAIGVHGQWIYIDRARQVAIVKQSSQPVSSDPVADEFILNAFDAVIDHLN